MVKQEMDLIPSSSAFEPEQQQRMFTLKKDDQGHIKYDTDDDEDIVMQSSSVISARFDTEESHQLLQQHSPPTRVDDTPRMLKRTKVSVRAADNHNTATVTSSSNNSSKKAHTSGSTGKQISDQNTGTKTKRDTCRRSSNNPTLGTTSSQDHPPYSSSSSRQQGSSRHHGEQTLRKPLQAINENVQGPNKKRRVNTKK
ncbi:hypothetical protein BDB00DRAFT_814112 [Zychaea mexicana]|uniref:uncharacterized protein n=1 Tax=Zychaea mexicana TaxID=64656 RepID=UPI0022FDE7A9|nr:uncharacterized protein BDB00DRAFT_814112 [Zychaea mexicana]KAI9495314.1 hypothetical protein BDB00DRAFT_814112 [Zychaea mexicana]